MNAASDKQSPSAARHHGKGSEGVGGDTIQPAAPCGDEEEEAGW